MKNYSLRNKYIIIIVLFIFSSRAYAMGAADWNYHIINGYELWRINSNAIHLVRVCETDDKAYSSIHTVLNNDFVIAFWNNQKYILIQAISDNDVSLYKTGTNVKKKYYTINTINHEIFGPYNDLIQAKNHIKNIEKKEIKLLLANYNNLSKDIKNKKDDIYTVVGIVFIVLMTLMILVFLIFILYFIYVLIVKRLKYYRKV